MNASVDVTDALTLRSITAYRKLRTRDYVDIDATQLQIGDVFVGVDQNQFSQEFQANYNSGPVQAVAGLYYLREHIISHQEAYANNLLGPLLGNPTFLRTVDDDLVTKSYAAYANVSVEVAPGLRLAAGGRYTSERKDYFRTTSTFSSFARADQRHAVRLRHGTTPGTISRRWARSIIRSDPNVMIYARVAQGFQSGGFNGRANSVAERTEYQPEKVTSYEAGVRSTIVGGRAAQRHRLLQRLSQLPGARRRHGHRRGRPACLRPSLSVINAGKLTTSGFEVEAVAGRRPRSRA